MEIKIVSDGILINGRLILHQETRENDRSDHRLGYDYVLDFLFKKLLNFTPIFRANFCYQNE